MKVYLIRHGSTAGNLEHRYVGTTDEPLTEEAVQDLRLLRGRYPVPERVIASPMERCRQSAHLLFPEREAQVLPGLQECDFGEFEYRNYKELQGNDAYQSWIDSGGTLAFPGGESREAFIDRCAAAFAQGCREAMEDNCDSVAFVVHGGTIMAVLDRYSVPHGDYFSWQASNGAGFAGEVSFDEKGLQISAITPLPGKTEPIGIEEQYVMKKNKKLRCGYTTGSCAAAAAKAAAEMLLGGEICHRVDLMTPKGIPLHLPSLEQSISDGKAVCAVRKYAGDDPDATDGALIYAAAERISEENEAERGADARLAQQPVDQKQSKEDADSISSQKKLQDEFVHGESADGEDQNRLSDELSQKKRSPQVIIDGGIGVGRVTKPGLEQPVGAAAINRVPREMITREVEAVCEKYAYAGRMRITISVPSGEEIAKKTFNPHIGILGGISILGTSGIVVPMSEEALIASIRVEMKQKYETGEQYLLITPGNYGADFIRKKELSAALDAEQSMKCSNYVGETLDIAAELGVKGILFVAHIGKFIKVSGGIMNTHSAQADCRAELIAAQTMRALCRQEQSGQLDETEKNSSDNRTDQTKGESCSESGTEFFQGPDPASAMKIVKRLLATNTTEEAVDILIEENLLETAMAEILSRIHFHLQKHCRGELQTEVILYSNHHGYLGETAGAQAMMEEIIRQNKELKRDTM
jgi:cobalt-precorrin-5B (C1)-methyltransferase